MANPIAQCLTAEEALADVKATIQGKDCPSNVKPVRKPLLLAVRTALETTRGIRHLLELAESFPWRILG